MTVGSMLALALGFGADGSGLLTLSSGHLLPIFGLSEGEGALPSLRPASAALRAEALCAVHVY